MLALLASLKKIELHNKKKNEICTTINDTMSNTRVSIYVSVNFQAVTFRK